jgi:hypothetical protein
MSHASARPLADPALAPGAQRRNRADALSLLGAPRPEDGVLPRALRRETERYFRRHVEPLIERTWPDVRETAFYRKLLIGAQQVYAPAPYTVVVVCARRPLVLRFFNRLCSLVRAPRALVELGMRFMLPLFVWLLLRRENRRIALMAAFIAVADEAFDHHLAHVDLEERPAVLQAVIERTHVPTEGAFALLGALVTALNEGCDDDERAELAHVLQGCVRWGEAEAARAKGEVDPYGVAHRTVGILTGIDGLAWTVRRHITERERAWMYLVSEFIQVLDDFVDVEKDALEGVRTPAATGVWNKDTVAELWAKSTALVGDIVVDNGERYPPYVELARASYRFQVQELLANMLCGVAE